MAAPITPSTVCSFEYHPDDKYLKKVFRFSKDSEGRIDPVTTELLEDGDTCYKINKCGHVLSKEGFTAIVVNSDKLCPTCRGPFVSSERYSKVDPNGNIIIQKIEYLVTDRFGRTSFHNAIVANDIVTVIGLCKVMDRSTLLKVLESKDQNGKKPMDLANSRIKALIRSRLEIKDSDRLDFGKDILVSRLGPPLTRPAPKPVSHSGPMSRFLMTNKDGKTVLHQAIERNDDKAINFLLRELIRTNNLFEILKIKDNLGRTPLHLLMIDKKGDFLKGILDKFSLSEKVALMEIKDNEGKTPGNYKFGPHSRPAPKLPAPAASPVPHKKPAASPFSKKDCKNMQALERAGKSRSEAYDRYLNSKLNKWLDEMFS